MAALGPGSQVYWWKRITRELEYPYRAEVEAVGPKRVTITGEDPCDARNRFTRHVVAASLQPVGGYFMKAVDQDPEILQPTASWGRFTRHMEVGDDLRAVRQVDLFENGNLLCYDRVHWVDDFGRLGDARLNRHRKRGPWGRSVEIEPDEFERIWRAARDSRLWRLQLGTAQMGRWGAVPIWFTVRRWHPGRGT